MVRSRTILILSVALIMSWVNLSQANTKGIVYQDPGFSAANHLEGESNDWILVEDFQQFNDGDVFKDAKEFEWDAVTWDDSEEYLILTDPHDPDNVSMFLDIDNELEGWGNVFALKALPGGGVAPGDTDTIFFRYLNYGNDNFFHAGTADKPLIYDPMTGGLIEPGSFGDFNALIRTVNDGTFELRDGNNFIATNPAVTFDELAWYNFWLVIRNTFDGSTSTGSYTLYIQGPDDEEPVLVTVPSSPAKERASFRRAPLDDSGNPQKIAWFMLATTSGHWEEPSAGDIFLLDDIYFSTGENLSLPKLTNEVIPELSAPSNLRATIVSDSRILLSWKDHSKNESGYKVLMQAGEEGDWVEIAQVPMENLGGYNVENLVNLLDYRFKVRAYADASESEFSNVAIPNRINPIWKDAEVDEKGWMKMEWFGRFTELDPDWIYYEELGAFYTIGEDASSFWFYSDMMGSWFWTTESVFPFVYKYGTYSGWYYYFRGGTQARWFARLSDKTFVTALTINDPLPKPLAPGNLSATKISPSRIQLSWEDNAEYEIGYKIFMKSGIAGEWIQIAAIPTRDLVEYIVYPVDTRSENSFRVQAYRVDDVSDFSNTDTISPSSDFSLHWRLLDDFQQFSDGQTFSEATEIGWNGLDAADTGEYWMITDPIDSGNVGMYLESGNNTGQRGQVFALKALPDGGIPPGSTDTIFLRYLNFGTNNNVQFGTMDRSFEFATATDEEFVFGAHWMDINASMRINNSGILEYRDEEMGYTTTDVKIGVDEYTWYNFWLVIRNNFVGNRSIGTFTIYRQGPLDDEPVLVPVQYNPLINTANFRALPLDDFGNPKNITWFTCASFASPTSPPNSQDIFLVDDIYYSNGENLSLPQLNNEEIPGLSAPSNLKATMVSDSRITLSWKDNDASEIGFEIFMKTGSDGEWINIATVPNPDLSSFSVFPVDTRLEHSFKVQAYNNFVDSQFSNVAIVNPSDSYTLHWSLIDDFQQFSDGQIFTEAMDIGWNASSPQGTDEYWMLGDEFDADNVAMYVESGNYGIGYGNVWCQKELPGGGIVPGATGTIFWRCLWSGFDNTWNIGTADKTIIYDDITGKQIAPGAWGDYNALIRLAVGQTLEHRDGGAYVPTNPTQVLEVYQWYSFWMVVENSYITSTVPAISTGIHTLYVAGPGFGDGVSPVLIPVGTDSPKDSAFFRRAPVDAIGNPQAIIWFMLATDSGSPAAPNSGDHFLIDDIYYSEGENLTTPE